MGATTAGGTMAKSRGRPKKPSGEGSPVRIDSDLVTKAKYLAALKGISMTELLSDILRPVIERDFQKAGRKLMEGP